MNCKGTNNFQKRNVICHLLALLLCFVLGECRFQDTNSRWTMSVEENVANGCNDEEFCQTTAHLKNDGCNYSIKPLKTDSFGAEVSGITLGNLTRSCADQLIQDAVMYRFLVFHDQNSLTWKDQIAFTESMGDGRAHMEAKTINRKFHPKVPDPRLGYFSNDPNEGLMYQGTEGWHVDGNTVENPHFFTIIHCVSANRNGPTLLVPLREIVEMFSVEERSYLEKIMFVSGNNASIQHPLIYKHPIRQDDTIMLALGSLSGRYLQINSDESKSELSKEKTQLIQDILETKILESNKIYTHHWRAGDLLILNNPSLAHIAGPGSQGSLEATGLRLMHRSTVPGQHCPTKKTNLEYFCEKHKPFQEGYCLYSLKGSIFYPRYGEFETIEEQRKRCKNVHQNADLATIPNEKWNQLAGKIVRMTGTPHWINATNPQDRIIKWEVPESWLSKNVSTWTYSNWDENSQQPNDCVVPETCIFIGPHGKWFDLTCGPKVVPDIDPTADPGPAIVWEDGRRYKFNVYPMCGILQKDIPFEIDTTN